ncbi:MAG: DUF6502 family protein [Burkholderiaceae bacterium]
MFGAALAVLVPLARLLVARGLKFGQVEELGSSRLSCRQAARTRAQRTRHQREPDQYRSTGIHRKDVMARLLESPSDPAVHGRSFAAEVFTRWVSDPYYRLRQAARAAAQRASGGERSFESLACSVSTDVHPKTLLDELRRLGIVELDEQAQTVRIAAGSFVPSKDSARMFALLGGNVGDHLQAAVSNVIGDRAPLLEQAVFADELSDESVQLAHEIARETWHATLQALAPMLEKRIAADRAAKRRADRRLRVGMYFYSDRQATPDATAAKPPRKARKPAKAEAKRG